MPIARPWNTGVYRWRNILNQKPYYGSTAKSFRERRQNHLKLLRNGRHHSIHFQHAWDKYGEESFVFEVVERCPPEQCLEREQHYLDTVRPWDPKIGYNRSRVAGSPMKGRKHSESTRKVLAKVWRGRTHSDETKAKMSQSMTGKKRSDEGRKAIAEAQRSRRERESAMGGTAAHLSEDARAKMATRKGKHWSPEMRARIAEANRVTKRHQAEERLAAIAPVIAPAPKRIALGR